MAIFFRQLYYALKGSIMSLSSGIYLGIQCNSKLHVVFLNEGFILTWEYSKQQLDLITID